MLDLNYIRRRDLEENRWYWATRPTQDQTFNDFESLQDYLEQLTGPQSIFVYVSPLWNSNNPNEYRRLIHIQYAVYRSEPDRQGQGSEPEWYTRFPDMKPAIFMYQAPIDSTSTTESRMNEYGTIEAAYVNARCDVQNNMCVPSKLDANGIWHDVYCRRTNEDPPDGNYGRCMTEGMARFAVSQYSRNPENGQQTYNEHYNKRTRLVKVHPRDPYCLPGQPYGLPASVVLV